MTLRISPHAIEQDQGPFIFPGIMIGSGPGLPSVPDGTLHVWSGSAGAVTAHANADDLVVESDGLGGISILVPGDTWASIYFGSAAVNNAGFLRYGGVTDTMQIGVAQTDVISIRVDTLTFTEASYTVRATGQLIITAGVSDEVVFNEDQEDVNTRMESNDREYMFFLDAGGNFIGMGNQPWGYWTPIAGHTTQLNISTPFAMATVTAPLILNNTSNSTNAYVGIMFSVEPGAYGKGYIGFKRDTGWGIGRLVFASDAGGDGSNVWPATDVRFEFTHQSYLVFPQATDIQVTGLLTITASADLFVDSDLLISGDVYPIGDARGFFARVVDRYSGAYTDHFRSGVIPGGYIWDLGALFGGVPAVVNYNIYSDYMQTGDAALCFLRRITTLAVSKGIYARCSARLGALVGVRIDDGNDAANRPFAECYLLNTASQQAVVFRYRTVVGGGITTTVTNVSHPAGEFLTIGVYINWDGSIYGQVMGEAGPFLVAAHGVVAWFGANCRVGVIENGGYGGDVDWFQDNF